MINGNEVLTSPTLISFWMTPLEGFCLMTDGLSESIGDAGIYFGSVWPELKQRLDDPASLTEYAEAFCRYWEDRKFSDDDKTLVAVFLNP
jgi:hypothetical protein